MAHEGKIKAAIVKFKQAKELALGFKFEPEGKAKRIASTAIFEKGEELANEGKIEEAVVEFERALKIDERVKLHNPEEYAKRLAANQN